MYFGFFSLFIVLGHMILLHLESPDMQLSNHQNFLFGMPTAYGQSNAYMPPWFMTLTCPKHTLNTSTGCTGCIIYITTTTSPTAIRIKHSCSFSAVVTFSSCYDHQNRPVYSACGLPWTAATNHRHNPSNKHSCLLWACSGHCCHHNNSATS